MELAPADPEELLKLLGAMQADAVRDIALILVDGSPLIGPLPETGISRSGRSYYLTERPNLGERSRSPYVCADQLEIQFTDDYSGGLNFGETGGWDSPHFFVYVPLTEIAGAFPFRFHERTTRLTPLPDDPRAQFLDNLLWGSASPPPSELRALLLRRALDVARAHSYEVVVSHPTYYPRHLGPLVWRDVILEGESPVYCDWDYFRTREGGINNIGAGFVVSASVGWERSLWRKLREALSRRARALGDVCQTSEAVVHGMLDVVHRVQPGGLIPSPPETVEMEGTDWVAMLVVQDRAIATSDLGRANSCLAFFKRSCFLFPFEHVERISSTLTIYAEVVAADVEIGGQRRQCFLRARAAAPAA
jgi:hypothetical protein